MNKKFITHTLLTMLAPAAISAQTLRQQVHLPDTIDEEDLQAMRDTMSMSRINRAKDKTQVNALNYAVRDVYEPKHQTFDRAWYDHIYVGAGYGVEQIRPQASGFTFRPMTTASLYVGKQLDKKNSVRLGLGGAWGYQHETNQWQTRVSMKADYLFNVSTHFYGYNPARRLEVSLMAGAGLGYAWMRNSDKQLSPEAHAGLQFKCFTGPLGTMNIEPYVGVASDRMDVSGSKNWRRYDVFYGVNLNCAFFLSDNLSKEARLAILQSRMADERMVDPQTLASWRTPWFVEYSQGAILSSSSEIDFGKTLGNQTTVTVGRWLSPVIGVRGSVTTRTTQWDRQTVNSNGQDITTAYDSHYTSGRIDAMLNPLGFLKSFRWDNNWGAYLTFGAELGRLTRYNGETKTQGRSEAYGLGVHVWRRLSEDLQVFAEPRFSHNVYTSANTQGTRTMHGTNNLGIDLGVSMLISSKRFMRLDEMDETQDYTYRDVRGLRVGIAGGMPVLQHGSSYVTGGGMSWNAMATAEYRFNHLHSVRAHADWLNLSSRVVGGDDEPVLWNTTHRMLIGSLNYQVSLTNLCSGRYLERNFELEGFAGPAIGFRVDDDHTLAYPGLVSVQERLATIPREGGKRTLTGLNAGLKLSTHVWKGISLTLTPTFYLLGGDTYMSGINTYRVLGMRMMQTLNLGVQYKIGKLRINPQVKRRRREAADEKWEKKQNALDRREIERLREKQDKRRQANRQ